MSKTTRKIVLALCAAFLLASAPALADDHRREHRRGDSHWQHGPDRKHWDGKHWDRDRGKHHKRWKKHGGGHGKHGRAVVIWHGHRHWKQPVQRHHRHHRHHDGYRQGGRDGWALYAILALRLVDSLNQSQQQSYAWAQQRAVAAPLGESIVWQDSGVYGSVTPLRDGADRNGRYCREFQHQITVGNRSRSGYGVACRQADGAWEIVS